MIRPSEELKYTLNLPLPPAFHLRQNTSQVLHVPSFFSYESPSTRWILTMITNKSSIKRLIKCGKHNSEIFSRFYQIPDRPVDLLGPDYALENPAYHQQYVMYLTPLAIAIYLKQSYAVELLLSIRDSEGHKIVHPAEPCFIQKVYRKGDKRLSNELFNSFPIILAIRRNFYEGVALLSLFGYTPQKQFSLIQREAFRETVILYRDVLDYITELLRSRPGLNVTKFLRILTDPNIGLTTFDIFVFDLELTAGHKWDYVSLFRRVVRVGLEKRFFREESATQLMNILEQIQIMGYFLGTAYLKVYYNGSPPSYQEQLLTDKDIEELAATDRISAIMERIPTIVKATRRDMLDLPAEELESRLHYDYQCCIGILFILFQRNLLLDREAHYLKIAKLLSKIMLDTNIVSYFFEKTDEELAVTFSEWSDDHIKEHIVTDFRTRMQDYLIFTDHSCIYFINKFGEVPSNLLHAPLMPNRHIEDSPIIRQLRYISRASLYPSANIDANVSNNPNPCIFNVFDNQDQVTLKLIPSNHAKGYSYAGIDSNFNQINLSNSHDDLSTQTNHLIIRPPRPVSKKQPSFNLRRFTSRSTLSRHKNTLEQRSSSAMSDVSNLFTNNSNEPFDIRTQLHELLETNEKWRNMLLSSHHDHISNKRVPLRFLKNQALNYDSGSDLIKRIQNKNCTKIDNLYNNYCAAAIMDIMTELSKQTYFSKNSLLNHGISNTFQTNLKSS